MSDATPTADICDEFETVVMSCTAQFRQFGARQRFSGPIQTVTCFEDNVLLRATLSDRGNGRVLVVDGGGSLRVALLGEQVAQLAADNGWSGVVLNAAVRDVEALGAIDVGLAALGSNPRRSGKKGDGTVGQPVAFGGALFRPGDVVHVDMDGVVVVPADGSTSVGARHGLPEA